MSLHPVKLARLTGPPTTALLILLSVLVLNAPPAHAATTGGNGFVAFSSTRGPHGLDIWVSRNDGSRPVDVTAALPGAHSEPTFSPEGGPHLAFVTALPGGPGDIWWSTEWGRDPFRATNTPYDERSPSFAPGGGNIAYSRAGWVGERAGPADIWAIPLSGSNPRPLVDSAADDVTPAWSQDGTLVAFSSDRRGDYGIYVVDLTSAARPPFAVRQVVAHGKRPQWNPSQRQVVYDYGGDIWLVDVNPETGRAVDAPRRLTTHPEGRRDSHPQFSPDRERILFQREDQVWIMEPDGSGQHRVEGIDLNSGDPDQQPDCTVGPITGGDDVMKGTGGPDLFCPSPGDDIIFGLGGNDVIFGGYGHEVIYAGGGNDLVQSGGARSILGDIIYGESGNDFLIGSPKRDAIYGGGGSDRLIGLESDDQLFARDGVKGNDLVQGSEGQDTCVGDPHDTIWCGNRASQQS